MIRGSVNARREATVSLKVRGPQGATSVLTFVIDTGFSGGLALPASLAVALGLPWRGHGHGTLADGSTILYDVYEADILWDGQHRRILIDTASEPLIGMELLHGHELVVQAVVGGAVTIEALP